MKPPYSPRPGGAPGPSRHGGKPAYAPGGRPSSAGGKPNHAKPAPAKHGHAPHGPAKHGQAKPAAAPARSETRLHAPRPPQHGTPQQIRRDQQPTPPRGAPDAPRGTVWLYGVHAVGAALVNPARRLRRLLLTEEAEAALVARVKPPWSLPHERTERARLDQLLGRDVVHQGIALLADLLAPAGLAQTLQRPGPIVVLDQVSDPRNVGAILRSAAAFGAAGVVTQDRNAPEETGALAKAASGALETVPLLRAVNIARTLIALKAAEFWVVGLDAAAPAPLSGPGLAGRRVALVLGAEGDGMRRLTRETCDELVGLATPGAMESLNVSAAAAIALYELTRRP
jgi:23S rRNA (guanosine2251-2'-O)-methyltransferase